MMTSRISNRRFRRAFRALTLALACVTVGPAATAVSFVEPATVFYGKVTGTGSSQPYPVTEGELRWTLRLANGTTVPLRTRLWPVNGGEFSYRIDVPHQALAFGLSTDAASVPLKASPEAHAVAEIQVDGVRARPAGGAGTTFTAEQIRRAATHRLDLEVALVAPDTDGDGIPDWWEKKYGGDLAPNGDADGDGVSNLAEYRAGTNPLQDSRQPAIVTREVFALADATSGVYLRAVDSDTPPSSLTYTLAEAPKSAELHLRNARPDPQQPDAVLAVGDHFTQADVIAGRLVVVHSGSAANSATFSVTLSDGRAANVTAPAAISISFERPSPELAAQVAQPKSALPASVDPASAEGQLLQKFLLAREAAAIVWNTAAETGPVEISAPSSAALSDAAASAYAAQFGAERPQALFGGRGPDRLVGGLADDFLSGGPGDNVLTGGRGADHFYIGAVGAGTDIVTDFNPAEGDVLDLTGVLGNTAGPLRQHLKISAEGAGTRLEVRRSAEVATAPDRTIVLSGTPVEGLDLVALADHGNLAVGPLQLPARLSVAAESNAAENGPRNGEFRFTRVGKIDEALSVRLVIKGSAVNGVDYASVPETLRFAPGQREVRVEVAPYADSQAEPAETVEVSLESSDAYELATARQATVTIADLVPVLHLEVLDGLATQNPPTPATLLISRDTVIDRSVLVRLDVRGSAAAGADYAALPRFVNLLPGQTTALLPITPQSAGGANIAKSVQVAIVPDVAYVVSGTKSAEVLLVGERLTLAGWRTRQFPGSTGPLSAFAAADPGALGIPNALRYAFGLDSAKPDPAQLPRAFVRDGYLNVEFKRRVEGEDLEFVAEVSQDLRSWTAAAERVERLVATEPGSNPAIVTFRSTRPVQEVPGQYLRVRVQVRP